MIKSLVCVTTASLILFSSLIVVPSSAFLTSKSAFISSPASGLSTRLLVKGFGDEPPKREKSEAQRKREAERNKYDEIAQKGGQEYCIFVRQFGSDDQQWLPCGSIAVPRSAQVSDAIFANEEALKVSIVRTFPKLRGYEAEFEYGFNMRIYPDDPVEVARKVTRSEGWTVGNWISNLLSPIDTSKLKSTE